MSSTNYPFVSGDPLEQRHSYTYFPYYGEVFLKQWRDSRENIRSRLGSQLLEASAPEFIGVLEGEEIETAKAFEFILGELKQVKPCKEARNLLRWFIQRFEVSKRIYPMYAVLGSRGKGSGNYRLMSPYVRFAEVLEASYEAEAHIPSLNAMLKCLDTLSSLVDELDSREKARLAHLINREQYFIANLVTKSGGDRSQQAIETNHTDTLKERSGGSISGFALNDVTLLVADTLRSRSYVQALLARDCRVGAIIMVATEGDSRWGQNDTPPPPPDPTLTPGLFVPDLRIPLLESCAKLSRSVEIVRSGTINCVEVISCLRNFDPALVVYSGFGGELVQPEILAVAGPFLHMHAGWLPDYRGSTTVYYSLLRSGECGVSAILLTPEIDAGEILVRRSYPAPPRGVELDYYYDGIIRSDVMMAVLQCWSDTGGLPPSEIQSIDDGEVYYIIHPVLKHLSMLWLESL